MVGMPYHLEKGPWCSVLEDYLNGQPDRSKTFLGELRKCRDPGMSIVDLPFLATPALAGDPHHETVDDRRNHLRRDWFGNYGPANSFVQATLDQLLKEEHNKPVRAKLESQGPLAPIATADEAVAFAQQVIAAVEQTPGAEMNGWAATGFWFQFHGDVESIFREALIRAIEVSLGLDHDDPIVNSYRHLPIEIFWKCPQRWFEGWVSWRWDATHATGQVMLMFATPGSGKPVLERPSQDAAAIQGPTSTLADLESGPEGPVGPGPSSGDPLSARQSAKGLWVVSHAEHAQLPSTPDIGGSRSGKWSVPSFGPSYVGTGNILCVQPSEFDGGVKPFGRPYVEPLALSDGETP